MANDTSLLNKKIIKADGREENFVTKKIFKGIFKAAENVGGTNESLAKDLSLEVIRFLKSKLNGESKIPSMLIGEAVEKVLIEKGHAKTAKAFIVFHENKKHLRQDKSSLGINDDIGLSYNTLYILKRRFLKRNEKGETVETPKQMYRRVAKFLASVESTKKKKKEWEDKFNAGQKLC